MTDSIKKAYEVCCGEAPGFMTHDVKKAVRSAATEKMSLHLESLQHSADVKKEGTSWDYRFLELARHISTWSKDPSTKCGAVIVDEKQRIVSVGYNGFPRNVEDTELRLYDRELKYELTMHAEMNAILFANTKLDGMTLYIYPLISCTRCAVSVIQSGIKKVISIKQTDDIKSRWGKSTDVSKAIFEEAGVEWKEL